MNNRDKLLKEFNSLEDQEFVELIPCKLCPRSAYIGQECTCSDKCSEYLDRPTIEYYYNSCSTRILADIVHTIVIDYPRELLDEVLPCLSSIGESSSIDHIESWLSINDE